MNTGSQVLQGKLLYVTDPKALHHITIKDVGIYDQPQDNIMFVHSVTCVYASDLLSFQIEPSYMGRLFGSCSWCVIHPIEMAWA